MSITLWKPEPDVVIHQALGKACEEATELAGILARCLIQGLDQSEPATGKPNRQALFEEIADLDAAVQWLRELLDDGYDQYDGARADRKLAGFHRWQRLLEADMAPQTAKTNPETSSPPGNQIRTAECDGKDAVPVTGQLPVGTASTNSLKRASEFPPSCCTAWEDCDHDGICHDPQQCKAIGPNHPEDFDNG